MQDTGSLTDIDRRAVVTGLAAVDPKVVLAF
jgi:hypothetical protein